MREQRSNVDVNGQYLLLFLLCCNSRFSLAIYFIHMKVNVTQWCLTLCDPMGYTVHGILWARRLGSSPPKDQTPVSRIAGRLFTS